MSEICVVLLLLAGVAGFAIWDEYKHPFVCDEQRTEVRQVCVEPRGHRCDQYAPREVTYCARGHRQ